MQVFGDLSNKDFFKKYGLKLLEEADVDYEKAFSDLKICLGSLFSWGFYSGKNIIVDGKMDKFHNAYGEEAAKEKFYNFFGHELGRIIRENYLPFESSKWQELQKMLGIKPDFTMYYDQFNKINQQIFCPAEIWVTELFNQILKGDSEVSLICVVKSELEYVERLNNKVLVAVEIENVKKNIAMNTWRKWFYSLWGQEYVDN